ncbi:DUF1512 domain-containing protein [Candidatus Bathyarchaeota archaeon]|nr:MAG: DUF1512 domain-containing protein [Candidatus Bathyarchaeota archaeon]TMI30618.1 MAG: DUF1512 domain-containing protein [Candidatus Bathyarchaeota archaeon]
MALPFFPLQFPGLDVTGPIGQVLQILLTAFFIGFIFFGQKLQMRMFLMEIDRGLKRLDFIRIQARDLTLKTVKEQGKPTADITPQINTLMEQFIIAPVDMDPSGIVRKFDHLLDVHDVKFKDDVRAIAPGASEPTLNNLGNLVEASWALNTIYRIVRHFYLLGRRTSSFFIILQLQALMPMVMQEAEAYMGAARAFAEGQPIGDGIGALVASRLMKDKAQRKVEKDVIVAETTMEDRRVIALKAEGPGGNVGKPGDAIRSIIEENQGKVSMVVMIDAALKFEGENSGDISEGIGAAIGGIGTERFKIEEEATKQRIPVYAVIVKESILEAITPMKKEILDAGEKVIERIKRLIIERTKPGDTVIVAGIGNTIGIGQ